MRITLEWDDVPVFATIRTEYGDYRVFTLKVDGKPFKAWVKLDIVYRFRGDDPEYMKMVDEQLTKTMERMFEEIFKKACAAIPEGTNLLGEEGQ